MRIFYALICISRTGSNSRNLYYFISNDSKYYLNHKTIHWKQYFRNMSFRWFKVLPNWEYSYIAMILSYTACLLHNKSRIFCFVPLKNALFLKHTQFDFTEGFRFIFLWLQQKNFAKCLESLHHRLAKLTPSSQQVGAVALPKTDVITMSRHKHCDRKWQEMHNLLNFG